MITKNFENKEALIKLSSQLMKARVNAGLRQVDVADKIGISPATLGCIEKGKNTPNVWTAIRLAVFFGLNTDSWLGDFELPMSIDTEKM